MGDLGDLPKNNARRRNQQCKLIFTGHPQALAKHLLKYFFTSPNGHPRNRKCLTSICLPKQSLTGGADLSGPSPDPHQHSLPGGQARASCPCYRAAPPALSLPCAPHTRPPGLKRPRGLGVSREPHSKHTSISPTSLRSLLKAARHFQKLFSCSHTHPTAPCWAFLGGGQRSSRTGKVLPQSP